MKPIEVAPIAEPATLLQSPPEVLVEIIMAQQKLIEQLASEFIKTAVQRYSQTFREAEGIG